VRIAFADHGYTGDGCAEAARNEGVELKVIRLLEAKESFLLLQRRWVVERSFIWLNRFRRLTKDYERLPETLAYLHFVVFSVLLIAHFSSLNQNACITPSRRGRHPSCRRSNARLPLHSASRD
jgi:hypothetical protein